MNDSERPTESAGPATPEAPPKALETARRLPTIAVVAAVLLAGLLLYSNSLGNGFHYDDHHVILSNSYLRAPLPSCLFAPLEKKAAGRPGTIAKGGACPYLRYPYIEPTGNFDGAWRPLVMLSLHLNYLLGGKDPLGYLAVNLLIHSLNAVLLLLIVLKLPLPLTDPQTGGPRWPVALGAALVFLCHPAAAQTVNFIWKRSGLLVATFTLAAGLAFVAYRRLEQRGEGTLLLKLLALASCAAALLCKGTGVLAPPFLVLLDLVFFRSWRDGAFRLLRRHAAPLLLAGGFVLLHRTWISTAQRVQRPSQGPRRDPASYLRTQLVVVPSYFAMALVPHGFSAVHHVQLRTKTDWWVIAGAALLLALLAVALALLGRMPELSFGVLWFLAALVPSSSIFSLYILKDDCRIYLPLIGVAVFAAGGLARLYRVVVRKVPTGAGIALVGFLALVILFSTATYTRSQNLVWRDDVSLWADALQRYPRSSIARINYAYALLQRGRPRDRRRAGVHLAAAIRLTPAKSRPYLSLGRLLIEEGRHEEALSYLRRGADLTPRSADGQEIVGDLAFRLGKHAIAARYLTRAAALRPRKPAVWYKLCAAHFAGRRPAAESACHRSVALGPRSLIYKMQLALVLQWRGKGSEALRILDVMRKKHSAHPIVRALEQRLRRRPPPGGTPGSPGQPASRPLAPQRAHPPTPPGSASGSRGS